MVEVLPSVATERTRSTMQVLLETGILGTMNQVTEWWCVWGGGSNWFIDFPPEDNLLRYFEGRLLLASPECFNSSVLTTEKSKIFSRG